MPRATSAASDLEGGHALLTIGQVLQRLSPEFADISSSKLRFLEERGLVSPQRTPSGYRKFSAADVERLRMILALQRDHYLPLKVIHEYLDELDAGRTPSLPGGVAATPTIFAAGRRWTRDDLARETGASPQLIADAIATSLLAPADDYPDDAVKLLSALVDLQKAGIEPRHLRGFLAALEREMGLLDSALSSAHRRSDATARAQRAERARELSGQLDVLRAVLTRGMLRRFEE